MIPKIACALFPLLLLALTSSAQDAKQQPVLEVTANSDGRLLFEARASVPLHRPSPEHFLLTEIDKGPIHLDFPSLEERFGGTVVLSKRTSLPFNATWTGGRLHLQNLASQKDAKEGEPGAVNGERFVDLRASAALEPGKRYRLTWACWPIGAAKAIEVSCDFNVDARPKEGGEVSLVGLELSAAKTTVKAGEAIAWAAHLVNRGNRQVTLIQPGDGSSCGWRTPWIEWRIDGQGPNGIAMRCGNFNALKPGEVVTLKPGERVALGAWLGQPSLPSPGNYKVALRYVNDPDKEWSGIPLGLHDKETLAQVCASSRVAVQSNAVEITITK